MAQTRRERLDKQRERQEKLRAERKASRKPSRDDIARLLLYWSITEMIGKGRAGELHRAQDALVDMLVGQGFDTSAADAAFDEIVDKYAGGWGFQRKVHLQAAVARHDTTTDTGRSPASAYDRFPVAQQPPQ